VTIHCNISLLKVTGNISDLRVSWVVV